LPAEEQAPTVNWVLMLGSTLFAAGGVALAGWMYLGQPGRAERVARHLAGFYQASRDRFYLDEIYNALIVQPLAGFAWFCRQFDFWFIDQLVDLIGRLPSLLGRVLSPLQNGLVQFYALLMILGLVGFLISILLQ